MKFPLKLEKRLETRKQQNAFRTLSSFNGLIDFYSNDYLGMTSSQMIYSRVSGILAEYNLKENGATGSRLLSGNHFLYNVAESYLAEFHHAEAALIFNSGYDANVGFFSSVPTREDVVLYDEFIHASIRDGIRMGDARAYKFLHNDFEDLKLKIKKLREGAKDRVIYVVTESVFSMDGDMPDLVKLVKLAQQEDVLLVIDEAHATGVFGKRGEGLVQELELTNNIFARIITFGKALGSHGAVVLGSRDLKDYLVNFARSLIYTTALPPHSIATVMASYQHMESRIGGTLEIENLRRRISFFRDELIKNNMQNCFIKSRSAIQCCVLSGNDRVKEISQSLEAEGFGVKAILSPTVPEGKERLRFCIHSYNSPGEISKVLQLLAGFIK